MSATIHALLDARYKEPGATEWSGGFEETVLIIADNYDHCDHTGTVCPTCSVSWERDYLFVTDPPWKQGPAPTGRELLRMQKDIETRYLRLYRDPHAQVATGSPILAERHLDDAIRLVYDSLMYGDYERALAATNMLLAYTARFVRDEYCIHEAAQRLHDAIRRLP